MGNKLKKILSYLLCAAMLGTVALVGAGSLKGTYADGASMSGPGTVRAGDTITVSLVTSLSGKYGFEGDLSYSSGLSLTGTSAGMSGWKLESNGGHFVGYDDNMSNPTKGGSTLMTMTFSVGSVAAGTSISVSMSNLTISDSSNGTNAGTATYSVTIAQPLSGNTNLSSLSVSGQTLSPAFAAGTKSYSLAEVDFSVSSLQVSATAEDSKSRVSIAGTDLAVGSNTITVTVTAESGAQSSYTITVSRKQDPNYVASKDTSLASLSVSAGSISPGFAATVTDYVVYLPFEAVGTSFDATGTAADAKAAGVTAGNIAALVEGANTTSVVCKAEDGTEGSYNITVYVMPKYAGSIPQIGDAPAVVPSDDKNKQDKDTEKEEINKDTKTETKKASGVKPLYVVLIALGTAVVVGGGTFGGCWYFMKSKKEETEF